MAKLVTLEEQHTDRQPPTVAIGGTTWLETEIAPVKLQEGGLGVNLSVRVCCELNLVYHVIILGVYAQNMSHTNQGFTYGANRLCWSTGRGNTVFL